MGSNDKETYQSRDFLFLEDQIIRDEEKSDESQTSLKISIIPTSVSLPIFTHSS